MADKKLMIDTSILIDYFRKTDKANSRLVAHFRQYNRLYISSITEFEVYNGATQLHKQFWEGMLLRLTVLDFDGKAARQAAEIVGQLRTKRKTIDKPDLFIAATAIVHGLAFDTLNLKHFVHIDNLALLTTRNDG
ncbi:type II toxin-antitoxin system VapC family toxin [Rhodocytophaga aerolata]|uniref:Ribonuclease VapC n=1 Tax=Rhodocytophaga aerolata TaxID=455078 RepID=A0ABT8R0Q0_9BACT|nr:type II toxin-antitoxin system VapC family toxin [Rhodocytophaga aerolata]MDO1445665.1 type II toxin-antitoxin system VapC family toxin [Rhodocytophaga aerolata]